jgi:hypothetical protein
MRTTNDCHSHTRNFVHPCSTIPEEIASRSPNFDPMTHTGWAGMFEEPSVSRRQAHFGGFVQPATDCSSAAIRCEPTSDVPVASRLRPAIGGCQCLFGDRDRLAKPASTSFREESWFEANEDTFHL